MVTCSESNEKVKTEEKIKLFVPHGLGVEVQLDVLLLPIGCVGNGQTQVTGELVHLLVIILERNISISVSGTVLFLHYINDERANIAIIKTQICNLKYQS